MTRRRVWCDSETDSLPPGHRPWEIALICDADGVDIERVIVVLDVDLAAADPKSLAMNGFHDRHPLGDRFAGYIDGVMYLPAPDAAVALEFYTADAEIVAAQPGFDLEGIAALLREHGFRPRWHYRTRCIESETAGFLQRDVGGLQDCAKQLGIPVDPSAVHSALGDARLVRACWEHIFRREASSGDAR